MLLAMILLVAFGFYPISDVRAQMLPKTAYASVPELISESGYPVERHRVSTADGYVLQLHRIPAGRRSVRRTPSAKGKKVVLLNHGLFGSASDFIIMGPKKSLAYILADAGYDVWLGNMRGTVYSAHKNMTRNDALFWDYSFHEHGSYDVPAMIDKVLAVTKVDKITYVGYSMGTTSFFVTMSERPEYNQKIKMFVALAPAVYLDNVRALADFGLKTLNFPATFRARGVHAVTLRDDMMQILAGGICNAKRPREELCMRFLYTIVGEDYDQNDFGMTPIIFARAQPASWKQLEHFGKVAITGNFVQFGADLDSPAATYKLDNLKVPTILFYGPNDQLTERRQIMRLAKKLNTTGVLKEARPVKFGKFNHLDFVFAKDVATLLNKDIVRTINVASKQ